MDEPPTPASRRLYNSPTEMWAQITVLGMVAVICLAGFWLFQLNQIEAKAEISASPATKPVSAKAPMRPHPQTLDSAKKAPAAKEPAQMAALPATPTAMTLAATAVPSPTIPTLRILSPSVAYVVQPGDTCISIASLFSVTVANLIAHNKLDSAACFLHAGNKIYIPTPALQGTAPLSGTPTLAYAEPKLLLPLDNAKADGNTRLVTMTWASSVVLADNEYYVVHIQSAGAVGTAQFRTKLPTLILRPEMLENPASRSFVWWVSLQNVAGQEGTNKPGAFRELSPASEPRRFSW